MQTPEEPPNANSHDDFPTSSIPPWEKNVDEQPLDLDEGPPSGRTRSKAFTPELDFSSLAWSFALSETAKVSERALLINLN